MQRGRMITGATQVVGVIGDPVAHSRSPAMHNAAFAAAGLDWVYLAWRVEPEALPAAVRGLRALGVRGFNVTVPHKVAILPLLDEVGEEAAAIGAVNTVVDCGGGWRGENTDAEGFLRSLLAFGVDPAGCRAVLLGAGGAARAVGYALVRGGAASLHLANRTEGRAHRLAGALGRWGSTALSAGGLGGAALRRMLAGADLVVNATSTALAGAGVPVPLEWLPPGRVYCDLAYGPAVAPVLEAARQRGLSVLGGEEMLLHQGALAFERWTGEKPSLDAMRAALRQAGEEESLSGPSK
ncbi:MAG: shikimate dehydrogenase [Bacillota bacterium]|nr:shikimate dehydrogenase [Bacillota bacterium]